MSAAHVRRGASNRARSRKAGSRVSVPKRLAAKLPVEQAQANKLAGWAFGVFALAVTTAKRSHATPDIPTVAETLPGYEAMSWFGVIGPKGLPQDIVRRWNSEINRIVRLPDIKERMDSLGIEPVVGPAELLREIVKRDIAKWQRVDKLAGIKPEG